MRALLSLLLATTALPVWADTLPATSRITAVTVYPEGAKLTREVTFTAPSPGAHDLLVTDLPATSEPGLIQITPGDGLQLGAFSLRADRLPPREDPLTPDQQAAKAEVERLEAALQTALLSLDAVQAQVDAAEAQVRFLSSFTGALPDGATPDSIKAMAAMIGAETLAARQAALAARADLYPAQKGVEDAQEALAKAQAALDALPSADMDYTALSVTLTAAAAGEQTVTITQYVSGASWRPFYDLNLTRDGGAALAFGRSVLVTQYTGEDWSDVDLTLSSSAPAQQAAPSTLWPELRSIGPEVVAEDRARKAVAEDALMGAVMAEAAPAPITAAAGVEGDTVVYRYPETVTVASGAEDLRLALDSLAFTPVVEAVAVPRFDRTAFVMASFTNASEEPLLPGEAMLYREGVLVGTTWLDVIAPGVETDVAFGALETLRIKREMPIAAEGETGVFTTSNERTESAVITVENTGEEGWPVRLLDQVPYSEQDALEVEVTATPAPTEVDVDGQRGILAWEMELPAGGKETITLEHRLSWPEGMVLR
ncbi:MAG: mucoidy inhibitor MuiA family protein [Rhodobacterales bacterium]|nr:MAG: mucoidy inhibitor MuiA family protein [Rhodobacterales bacterium]